MKLPVTIPIALVNLKRQKILEVFRCELILRENHYQVAMNFMAEEPLLDEAMPWEVVTTDFVFTGRRNQVNGLEMAWLNDSQKWRIEIANNGVAQDVRLYFERSADCEPIYHQLIEYFFNNNPT